jgi:hypothetical protein
MTDKMRVKNEKLWSVVFVNSRLTPCFLLTWMRETLVRKSEQMSALAHLCNSAHRAGARPIRALSRG